MAELLENQPQMLTRDIIAKEHPDYQALYRSLRFGRENYEGSGGYASFLDDVMVSDIQPDDQQTGTIQPDVNRRTYLFRHPREKKKFERRVMMAYLTNVVKKAVAMIGGFLTKKQPIYDDYPKSVKNWMSSVNAKGDTWESYKSDDIWPALAYYGFLPVIFYRLETDAVTAEQQVAQGGNLRVDILNPENIVDWQVDAAGDYVWLKTKTLVDLTTPDDQEQVLIERYTWYTQDGKYHVDDADGKSSELPIEGVVSWPNGLPIVVWRLKGGALTRDANAVQREAYNINSLIQEQERETTFSMIRAPGSAPQQNARVVTGAVDNIWWYPEDARHPPDWMAPPPQVLAHLMAKRVVLAEEILELMGLDFDKGGGQTGMAFQFKMSKIVRMLQGLATSLSVAESQSLERVATEHGDPLKDGVRCVWPREFDAKDVEKELDGLERVLDRVKSAAAQSEAQYRMATSAMGNLDEKIRTEIRKEIDESIEEEGLDEDNELTPEELALAQAQQGNQSPQPNPEKPGDIKSDGSSR
jgi:hypothetical protein